MKKIPNFSYVLEALLQILFRKPITGRVRIWLDFLGRREGLWEINEWSDKGDSSLVNYNYSSL